MGQISFITGGEISLLTGELDCNKSSGSDGIPNDFYKYAPVPTLRCLADVIIRPIVRIISEILVVVVFIDP